MRNTNRVFESWGYTLGIPMTNLVTNGDFSNGTTGWFASNLAVTISAASNILTFIATGSGAVRQNVSITVGHKYYLKSSVKATSTLVKIAFYDGISVFEAAAHSGSGNYEKLSAVFTAGNSTASAQIQPVRDNRTSGFDNVYVKNVLAIDLTATFGAGNEPTAAEMDAMTATWFNGTAYQPVTGYLKSLDRSRYANNAVLSGGAAWKKVNDQYVLDLPSNTSKATIAANKSIDNLSQITFRCVAHYGSTTNGDKYLLHKAYAPFSGNRGGIGALMDPLAHHIVFYKDFSTRVGIWHTLTDSTLHENWYSIQITYDASSVNNNPKISINGLSATVTRQQQPIGTPIDDSVYNLILGNDPSVGYYLNGAMSDIQILNRIATVAEGKRWHNSVCRRYGLQPIA